MLLPAVLCAAPAKAAAPAKTAAPVQRLDNAFLSPATAAHDAPTRSVAFPKLELALRVDLARGQLLGDATWTLSFRRPPQPGDVVAFDAVDLDIKEVVRVGPGKQLRWAQTADQLIVTLPADVSDTMRLRMRWQATPRRGFFFSRPDEDTPGLPLHAWTQGETEQTRHWLPSPDFPDARVAWRVAVTAPRALVVLSNGERVGKPKPGPDGMATTTWRLDRPHPIYLLNVAIGPFEVTRHPHPRTRLETWSLPQDKARVAAQYKALPAMLDFFESTLGVRYPFRSYRQVVVHAFPFGGMENVTLTTLTSRSLRLDARALLDGDASGLLAHELAHQWFGDWVTARTWGDIWLHEGFATYFQRLYRRHADGQARFAEEMDGARRAYLREAHTRYSRPLATDRYVSPDALFDRHSYLKGAWTLQMLRMRLGDEAFFAGIAAWLRAFRFGNSESVDLRRALEAASGQSLRAFFRRWVHAPGHPRVHAKLRYDATSRQLTITLDQQQRASAVAPLFAMRVAVDIHRGGDAPLQRVYLPFDGKRAVWTGVFADPPAAVALDPQMAWLIDWQIEGDLSLLVGMARLPTHPDARLHGVRALAQQIARAGAIDGLVDVLRHDPARHVRAAAAAALGKAADLRAAAALRDGLQRDAESLVRSACAKALGAAHDADAWALLERAAKADRSYRVQRDALGALYQLDPARSLPTLRAAVQRKSHRSRVEGAALLRLGRRAESADLDTLRTLARPGHDKDLRGHAAMGLAAAAAVRPALRESVRPLLEAMLRDSEPSLRGAVARALGVLGDPASRPALQDAIARETGISARRALRAAVAQLGSKTPLDQRLRRLEDELARLAREGTTGHDKAGGAAGHAP